MLRNFTRGIITIIGIAIGPSLVLLAYEIIKNAGGGDPIRDLQPWANILLFIASGLLFGIIFFISSGRIMKWIDNLGKAFEETLSRLPKGSAMGGALGLIAGLIVAFLLSFLVNNINITWITLPINILLYLICSVFGVRLGMKIVPDMALENLKYVERAAERAAEKAERTAEKAAREALKAEKADRDRLDKERRKGRRKGRLETPDYFAPKILDTSVIIDGRIFDICKTGMLEGTLLVPEFVLGELRHIADSSDSLKRAKGRRGLDILSRMQKELEIPVEVCDIDYDDMEVDARLLKLAQELGGKVITNDFNLNKVAAVQGVSVFNINDLANAIKPVLLPGEDLKVQIIREGKEAGQGVAYLDDGTMIVVENARNRIGDTLRVTVTSVLQTSAGRMIFAKVKEKEHY